MSSILTRKETSTSIYISGIVKNGSKPRDLAS